MVSSLVVILAFLVAVALIAYFLWRLSSYRSALSALRSQLESGEVLSSRVAELEAALTPLREKLRALRLAQNENTSLNLQLEMNHWLLSAFATEEDAETILSEALAMCTRWFGASCAVYLRYEPDQRGFVFYDSRGEGFQEWMRSIQMTVSLSPYLLKRVYSLREAGIFRKGEEETSIIFGPGAPDCSLVGFLRRSGNQYGLIIAYISDSPSPGSPVFLRFEQFVRFLSVYLDYARIARETHQRLRDLEAIHQVHLQIGSMRDFGDVLQASVESVARALGIEIGMLELLENNELVLTACSGIDGWRDADFRRLKVGESLSGWVAEHGQSLAVENMEQDPRFKFKESARERGFKSYIGAPLRVSGRLIGVLSAVSLSPRRFTANEIELLNTLAGSLGVYIEQTRTYQNLQDRLWNLERQVLNLKEYTGDLESSFRAARQFEHTKSEIQLSLVRDLRETFTVLGGIAENPVPQTPATTDEVQRWIQKARNSLNQLQEVTRVRPGTLSFDLVRADPSEILTRILQEVRPLMDSSGIMFVQEITLPEGTIRARIDRSKLHEAASAVFRFLLRQASPGDNVNARLEWYVPEPTDARGLVGGSFIRLTTRTSILRDPSLARPLESSPGSLIPPDLFLARSLLEIQGGGLNFQIHEGVCEIAIWLPAQLDRPQKESRVSQPEVASPATPRVPRLSVYISASTPNPGFTEFLIQHARNLGVHEFRNRDDLFQRCRVAPPDAIVYYGTVSPDFFALYSSLNQILPYSVPFLAVHPQSSRVLSATRLTDALLLHLNGPCSFSFDSILRRASTPTALQAVLKSYRTFPLVVVYDFPVSDQIVRSLNEFLQTGAVVLLGDLESHKRAESVIRSLWTLPE
ncbi:MAG: GAF domain-containing protein [bacterium JZ-2024 1]